jgi:hypothetical protein
MRMWPETAAPLRASSARRIAHDKGQAFENQPAERSRGA